jgi:hypothetical protein
MMTRSRARINRQIMPVTPTTDAAERGAVTGESNAGVDNIVFHDAWGRVEQRFDVAELRLPGDLATLLAEAFRAHYTGTAATTRDVAWRALLLFTRFVVEDGRIHTARDLTTEALGRYVVWLGRLRSPTGAPLSRSTRSGRFNLLRPLLAWVKRHRPERIPSDLEFPYNPFPRYRDGQRARTRLPELHLKAILRACYEEIDIAWTRFEQGRAIVASPTLPPPVLRGEGLARWLWRIHRINNGVVPDTAALEQNGICPGTLRRYGSLHTIAQYLHLTSDTMVPFYLAIAIQAAANPDPLRCIARDCLVPHPLDEHRVIVDWSKPKTAAKLKRTQRRSFDRRRPYAAPNLIEKVLTMSAPLVSCAPPQHRDRLFIVKRLKSGRARLGGGVALIDIWTLRSAIRRFRRRTNARIKAWNTAHPDRSPRPPLPNFAPAFFRGSVATEHYMASGGDILVAQAVLNHVDPVTTETYIKGPETRRLQHETIARVQALMLAWIAGNKTDTSEQAADPARAPATVLFSHDCLNPLVGGASPTRLCPHYGGCLVCPGLVIPVDAEHLARVLHAKRHLEAARDRLEPARWELLYAPSHRILVNDVLPDFPDELVPLAQRLISALPPLPDLE